MNKKILFTAFEPFGGLDMNSSSMVLDNLKDGYGDTAIVKMTLPVLYKEAFDMLLKNIHNLQPDAVVCMGQAGGRQDICIERLAVNINHSNSPDNGGVSKNDAKIINEGPAAYFTNLPSDAMLSAGNGHVRLSFSAGTYICNDIFYRLMNYIETEGYGIKGGFLHLPFTEHFGKMPYKNLKTQLEAIESMLAVMGENDENQY